MATPTPTTPQLRRASDRPAGALPPPPADAQLVALCAELGTNERERRRLIASLPGQRGSVVARHAALARLTVERHSLIARIMGMKARTIDGIKTKAAVVRLLVDDLPVLGDARLGMADSLATDTVRVLA